MTGPRRPSQPPALAVNDGPIGPVRKRQLAVTGDGASSFTHLNDATATVLALERNGPAIYDMGAGLARRHPDGRTLYAAVDGLDGEVGQVAPNRVDVIDTAVGRVRTSIQWKVPPEQLAMAPSGATVWVRSVSGDRRSTAGYTLTPVSVASDQPGPVHPHRRVAQRRRGRTAIAGMQGTHASRGHPHRRGDHPLA